jgi:HD-GYP domain-containing protein (c-di-GMP phosphodiesterase class II)
MGLPFENGLQSTLVAMQLADRLGADTLTARQTYYASLLFYGGCTADAEIQTELFANGGLEHLHPVLFGSPREMFAGVLKSLAAGEGSRVNRTAQLAWKIPKTASGNKRHLSAICEIIGLLSDSLGLPPDVTGLFADLTERWDGKGPRRRAKQYEIPFAIRIAQVAQDAVFHALNHDVDHVASVIAQRSGAAFDPAVATAFCDAPDDILAVTRQDSAWNAVLAAEPSPHRRTIDADTSLAALGAFADLVSPHLFGHSMAVAELAARAAKVRGCSDDDVTMVRRAGLIHDLGRVSVPCAVWRRPGALSADDWEKVRLHPYQTERVLDRSAYLGSLARVAGCHHERLDGSGYHRGTPAAGLGSLARLLAAADAYQTKIESRAHRKALPPEAAAGHLRAEASAGRLDPDSVAAVLTEAGHRPGPINRPGGLTDREAQVLVLLARGLATKQIGRTLGVTAKTADHYIQRVYAKIGVSTRASAAIYAMTDGFTTWENSHS